MWGDQDSYGWMDELFPSNRVPRRIRIQRRINTLILLLAAAAIVVAVFLLSGPAI